MSGPPKGLPDLMTQPLAFLEYWFTWSQWSGRRDVRQAIKYLYWERAEMKYFWPEIS